MYRVKNAKKERETAKYAYVQDKTYIEICGA